jgi:hypothetical protein
MSREHGPSPDDLRPIFVGMQDQHKATSHLLESQSHPYAFENSQGAHPNQQQPFRGYDDDDVRALNGSGSAAEGEWSKPPTAVLWRGLPFYLLTWDLLSIGLCICFLGTRNASLMPTNPVAMLTRP